MSRQPDPEAAALKRECLAEYERLAEAGDIDVFYGDESRVSMQPCVPYGWQFPGEGAGMPSGGAGGVNCLALISRRCECRAWMTQGAVTAERVSEALDALSWEIGRPTVVVLDNASPHRKAYRERNAVWQARGLFVWLLPEYSPHLNLAETLWRKLKYEWLRPEDYACPETLRLAVWHALRAVGRDLTINFSPVRID